MSKMLTIHDIHKRLRGLSANKYNYSSICEENAAISIKNGIPKDIMKSIENTCRNSNPIQFESVLNLFDALYEHGTTGQMIKMANYICEEAAPKVRDAKSTNTNLRHKLGRIKSKLTTKIANNIEDAQNEIYGKIHAAQNNFKSNTSQIKNNISKGLHINKPNSKNEAYIKCYESFIETLSMYEDCDRILENYDKISRRFNLERLFIENTRINGVQDTVNELCQFVDTYDIPDIVKYNTVIETAWYGFSHNGIDFNKKELLESATDYFLMKKDGLESCRKILENTMIFDPKDMPACMQLITELDPEESDSVFTMHDKIKDQLTESSTELIIENYDFNKIFNDFKKQEDDNKETKLMWLVRKLYTKNVNNIVDETPNFLNWIRLVFVLGTVALNPVLGAVVAIGDIFARLHFEREETEKMIKCFDNEIKKSQDKMKSTKDEEEKKRLKEYIDALKKARNKIDAYYEKMLSDKELDAKYDSSSTDIDTFDDLKLDIKDSDSDDDFNWDDDDFDWDDDELLEAAVNTINNISSLVDNVEEYKNIGMDTIANMSIFNGDDLDSLAKLSVMFPDVWSPELMENAIDGQIYRSVKNLITFESTLDRFITMNAYDTSRRTIHSFKYISPTTIGEAVNELYCLSECVEAINSILYTHRNKSVMVEASFLNSLKLASEKLKKNIQKLSDKEKTMSKNVDVSLSQFKKGVENSLNNENREAVIKGSVLPPASKIIKLAITTGALWLVNPAIAVITAIGYLGLSAHHKAKERQLILDELEVELKMCEKYIDIAESKNDMKSLKQLLTIQKNLKRQEQRIRYRMKVDFNQNVPNTAD